MRLLSILCTLTPILALISAGSVSTSAQTAQSGLAVPSRVVEHVDDTRLVRLTGNTVPMARPAFDQGLLDPGKPLNKLILVLRRSPEQERALAAFNERQYDPKSPDFHHWLTATEFGQLYGPNDGDIAQITSWLQNHGLRIDEVAKGRTWIQFTGTVAQVQEAFHLEMHKYLVKGEAHISNDRDPQIPRALEPVVAGISSLNDFFPKPQIVLGNLVKRDRKTGKVTLLETQPPVAGSGLGPIKAPLPESGLAEADSGAGRFGVTPAYTYTDADGFVHEDVTPYDFATIYNVLPLWQASTPIVGTGVKVAIAATTDVDLTDIANFRSTFGLPATTVNVIQTDPSNDPGTGTDGVDAENTLDLEMVSAAAPGASLNLVVTGDTATTFGNQVSSAYIIDNEVAPIMSASYGLCELFLGTAGNIATNQIWQQGATEGISIFVSSGDQGSAGCDFHATTADQDGLQVNGLASSPYVTAVGGTDLGWFYQSNQDNAAARDPYWNTSNSANGATAKGYMPEIVWNTTCANPGLLIDFASASTGQPFTSTEALCNAVESSSGYKGLVSIGGGSGGVSSCTTSSSTEIEPGSSLPASPDPALSSCSEGYTKPSWQSALTPADGHRDLPDISMFSAGGYGTESLASELPSSAILFCDSSNSNGVCDYTDPEYIIYQEVGGTSAASPYSAGVMALVLQKNNGQKQGLANPVFYKMAASQSTSACNSSTVAAGNSCLFYDVTEGTNAMACVAGGQNCTASTAGDTIAILSGYSAGVGYDLATGLGTMNVANLVNSWAAFTGGPTIALSPTTLAFASTTVGSTTAAQVVTVKNTGTAAATLTSETLTGTGASSFLISANTCTTSLAVGASCAVSIEFKPASAAAFSASLSVADNATGSPQTVALSGTGTNPQTLTVTLSPTTLAFASTTVGSTTAAQVVTVKNTGTAAATLTSETLTGTGASSFLISANTCTTSLAAGASCAVSVEFKPASAAAFSASLSVADNATGSPQTVALSGTGTPPVTGGTLSVTPASLSFASTAVGSATAPLQVIVKNTGTTTVTFTGFTYTGANTSSFVESGINCGTTLAAGATCAVAIEFKPQSAGALTATLNIADNATGSPQTVALSGTGTGTGGGGTLSVTPASLAFASTNVGSVTAAQQVIVKNTGTTTVTFTGFTYTGANTSSFVQSGINCGTTLAAGAACAIAIEFKPQSSGTLTATLNIADNATGSPQKVTLTGTGTGGTAATVTLSPTSLAFPNTIVGSTSDAQVVTLTNTGSISVTVSSITLTGASPSSYLELTNCGATLAASASCSIYVAFKPASAAALAATLSVADSATGSPQTVALTGTGTAAPSVKLSATSLAFGTVAHGTTSAAQMLTLTNSGTATLTLTSITLGGTGAADFEALDTCGATLAPSASCTVYVAFKPAAAAAYTATLSIADNGSASPQSVALSGTGD